MAVFGVAQFDQRLFGQYWFLPVLYLSNPAGVSDEARRAMLDGLSTLERDTHQHIHKENNLLHPRAIELEASLLPTSDD